MEQQLKAGSSSVCFVTLTTCVCSVVSDGKMTKQKIGKENGVAYFKILSQHLPRHKYFG
jgi:hypothetical protein